MFVRFTDTELAAVSKFRGKQESLNQLLHRFAPSELFDIGLSQLDVIRTLLRCGLPLEDQQRKLAGKLGEKLSTRWAGIFSLLREGLLPILNATLDEGIVMVTFLTVFLDGRTNRRHFLIGKRLVVDLLVSLELRLSDPAEVRHIFPKKRHAALDGALVIPSVEPHTLAVSTKLIVAHFGELGIGQGVINQRSRTQFF